MNIRLRTLATAGAATALLGAGCAHVKVDPIQVQTIHIVHDVNIRVDKTLDDFFAFQEQQAGGATKPTTGQTIVAASTAPATSPAGPTTAAAAGDVK